MNDLYEQVTQIILDVLKKKFNYQPSLIERSNIQTDSCKNPKHGDVSNNILMICRKTLPTNESDLLLAISTTLKEHFPIENIEQAGAGFLNIKFTKEFWHIYLKNLINDIQSFAFPNIGQNEKVLVEFLSANPTGPIHIGHTRNAVLGDAIARILKATGFHTIKEYYINDAGGQIENLGQSLYLRYLEQNGKKIKDSDFTKDMYSGEYLIPIAKKLKQEYEDQYVNYFDKEFFKHYAVKQMMDQIQEDLKKLNIQFDVFTSETKLLQKGLLEEACNKLKTQGDIYEGTLEKPKDWDGEWEQRKQMLFASTKYDDDSDRALKKADGSWTYFAGDIAYHFDKYKRGFSTLVNVLGADHIGYVKRLKAAVSAVSNRKCHLDIKLCQLVKFLKQGQPLRMSKRNNTFITMTDVLNEIGSDALRFMLLTRRHDMSLDFDLQKVLEKTKDNPVFYVQYAVARFSSVQKKFIDVFQKPDASSLHLLTQDFEIEIIKTLTEWPKHLKLAALTYEPHRVTNYLYRLASLFHSLWSKKINEENYRIIEAQDYKLSSARIILLEAVYKIIKIGLNILGVNAPEEM